MKYILTLLLCAGLVMGCGGRSDKNAVAGDTHIHTDGKTCDGATEHGHGQAGASHADGHDHGHAAENPGQHSHNDKCDGGSRADDPRTAGSGYDEHGHEAELADAIVFPASQAAKTDFEVQVVSAGAFSEVIKTAAQVLPAQGDEVVLAATAGGIVSFANTRIAEGTQVGKGQRLFYISSRNIAPGDILAKNKAAYDKAAAAFERAGKLLSDRIISQSEYDDAEMAFEQARAEYEALSVDGSDRGVAVSSPIGGYVTSLAVKEGDYVETGRILGSVSQNRNLILRAELSQRYLPRLKYVTGANFTVPYDDTTYELSKLNGRLLSVSRSSLAGTTLVPVTFEFANNGTVIPGTYVEAYLLGAREDNVISLPLTAVTEQHGLYYVYVQLDEEHYVRREVALGGGDGLRVKVLSGISPGEKVVTRGAVNVKMAAASGEIPHGHEH